MSFPTGKKIIVAEILYEKINALDFETELANKANTRIVCIGTKFGGKEATLLKNCVKFFVNGNFQKNLTYFKENLHTYSRQTSSSAF